MRGANSDGVLREALRQLQGGQSDAEPGETWTQEQWCEAFSFLFLAAPGSRHALLEHQDDMLWFVTAPAALGLGTPPVSLRRNTSSELPPELRPGGSAFPTVDWGLSVQLNLVVQAKYILTVVQCRQHSLAHVAQGHATSGHCSSSGHPVATQTHPHVVVAQRRVFASPMAADVNLEEAKSGRPPTACYPDVCFAVDNYEDAFQDVILSLREDCYCVMLHVHSSTASSTSDNDSGSAASAGDSKFPGPEQPEESDSSSHKRASPSAPVQAQPPQQQPQQLQQPAEKRAVLFSAYVTREQVAAYLAQRAAEAPKPSLLNRLLGGPRPGDGAAGKPRRDKVVMIGPGAVGRAEVLAAAADTAPAGGLSSGGAAGAAGGEGVTPLQLSLMWMSLPATALAQAVLRFGSEGHL
ncbi:hypothetical protein PLESTB_000361500 [Pleodorina starrii]|uniref:Uncharacterized protein n=1 Tax=Pleodorina starrii TaxID=330485 RepID=A0A9W6BDQ7_9CHLO|nr:hypothetical protein PLESTM_000033700 [Pleodorina starrii]GLC50274.1 hypothetical protein PLESTB_000361500 [Pleodorina starrii]GLC64342.1 hypothetical protein PLESTF_000151100 [Pleodorina starrii]